MFCLAGNLSVYLVVYVNFFHEVLANMVEQLMKVAVIVINVACVWCMVIVSFKDGKGYSGVDAQSVDRHKAFVTSLLLDDRELAVAEVLRTDAHKVAVSLTKITA